MVKRRTSPGEAALYDRPPAGNTNYPSNRLDDQADPPRNEAGTPICGHLVARTQKRCQNPAGQRTSHPGHGRCGLHGGTVGTVVTHATKQQAAMLSTAYGAPVVISADEALEEELHRTAGHVRWLGQVVASLAEEGPGVIDEHGRRLTKVDGKTHALIWGKTKSEVEYHEGDDKSGGDYRLSRETYEAGAHVWLRMYMAERAHLLQVSRTIIAAGLEQRRLDWAERVAGQMIDAFELLVREIGADPNDPKVRAAMATSLELVAGAG